MNREQMLKRLKADDKPIDISIDKWIDILEGVGYDTTAHNCACCETYTFCIGCPLNKYSIMNKRVGCGGIYDGERILDYIDKQCMLSFLYVVKEEMIKDGVY